MTIPEVLGWIGGSYVILTYVVSKLFPRSENISASDSRYINRR